MCRLLLKTKIEGERNLFEKALSLMKNGGPDSTRVLEYQDILFGHNRLAIIDPRPQADQPMVIEGNAILFNGEIYNYKELIKEHDLKPKTNCDTEVILLLYNLYGDISFELLDGEYAIAIYDIDKNEIVLARDPLGIKHLYWSDFNKELVVSSEIKGIVPFIGDLNMNNIEEWLTLGYTTGEETMYENIYKVEPNTIMRFSLDEDTSNSYQRIKYDVLDIVDQNTDDLTEIEKTPITEVLHKAVGKRMMSDVPVSCTLSGGIDSSLVAYYMRMFSQTPVKTYTVGFEGCENEFEQARQVSDLFGTDHTEVLITIQDVIDNIDDIVKTMEEPIDRGSLIPTYFLARSIQEKVTLIGEGADELFAGYSRHKWLNEHPHADFEEYFNQQLKSFKIDHLDYPSYLKSDIEQDKNNALVFDLETEIPNYHTSRIDKCMMRFGVEARVPFLDPLVVKKALSIPYEEKQSPEKKALREAYRGILPDSIIDRPKKALKFPFHLLIQNEEVEKIIKEDNDETAKEIIEELYKGLKRGDKDAGRNLWNLFLLKKWIKINQMPDYTPEN